MLKLEELGNVSEGACTARAPCGSLFAHICEMPNRSSTYHAVPASYSVDEQRSTSSASQSPNSFRGMLAAPVGSRTMTVTANGLELQIVDTGPGTVRAMKILQTLSTYICLDI